MIGRKAKLRLTLLGITMLFICLLGGAITAGAYYSPGLALVGSSTAMFLMIAGTMWAYHKFEKEVSSQ